MNGLASAWINQHKGIRQVPILDGRIGKPVKFRHVPNAVRRTVIVFMPLEFPGRRR